MLKELLTAPTEELGRWGRFVVFQIRLWPRCVRLLKQNRSKQQAASLSYYTLFGIVPLVIMMLMAFQLLPAYRDVSDNVRNFAYKQLHLDKIEYPPEVEGEEPIKLTVKIDEITETFIENLNTRAIGLISACIVVYAALALLTTIERAFNAIWHVNRGRSFLHKIINYWALLTLGPLLLLVGFYASTHNLLAPEFQRGVMSHIRPILPYLISVVAFFLLYFVLPNTKVNAKAAIWGASVAALIWTVAKYLFSLYVIKVVPGYATYGMLGIIPLGILWIYITWQIVLFGLQLTYTTQHLKSLDKADLIAISKHDEIFMPSDFTAIKILGFIFDIFENRNAPVDAETICAKLDLPSEFAGRILEHLVAQGLLLKVSEPTTGFVLARDGKDITLAEIAKAATKAGFGQNEEWNNAILAGIMDNQRNMLAEYTLDTIIQRPIVTETAVETPPDPPAEPAETPEPPDSN